jgi:DNA mismatch repair protein MutS
MATPVQRQYQNLKAENPEALLFFQLGDFYEMFHEDAKVGSRLLGLTLTARHRGTESEMPMCGMPKRSLKGYLEQLVELGHRVAVADQYTLEDGSIGRKITRVVSPGATVEDGTLQPDNNTYIAAIARQESKQAVFYAVAIADLSTGEFQTAIFHDEISFLDELWKRNPREILMPSDLFDDAEWCKKLPKSLQTPRKSLNKSQSTSVLQDHFSVKNLDKFGLGQLDILVQVSATILKFLQDTQKTNLGHIRTLKRYSTSEFMTLDAQTMRHLEVFNSIDPTQKQASLLSVFEKPFTPMGGRLVRTWLASPLLDGKKIQARHRCVRNIKNNFERRNNLTEALKEICDLERVLTRIVMKRCNARDLVFLRRSVQMFPGLKLTCEDFALPVLKKFAADFSDFDALYEELEKALIDTPPLEITEGGIFRDGYDQDLDDYRLLKKSADNWLANFLETKKQESGIDKLKVKFSKTFGFCLEAPKMAAKNAPETWSRRQTLVNAERFTTPELAEFESRMLQAESNTFTREHDLFHVLRNKIIQQTARLQKASQAIAELDTLLSFARTAERWNWCEPEFQGVNEKKVETKNISSQEKKSILNITNGRHPVVEKISTETFIANDLQMGEGSKFHLITGPNMAGKSTFLRQNAIIILLAQIGSFVPADACVMTVFDRIFTRVGASDNLAGGKSTFMVEMSETARILNAATHQSFVILDEIGRGTSTFDGISLAWSIAEYLHNHTKASTIFATHYHEMIECTEALPNGKNFHVSVTQDQDRIIFLRKILPGGVSDSFGIEVAISAGFPKSVIKRSRSVLQRLEQMADDTPQQALFTFTENENDTTEEITPTTQKKSELEKKFDEIDIDNLSPRQALDTLYELKKLL